MRKFIHDTYKNATEAILPPLAHSQFKEKGVLTPEEFVSAGDFLVQTCPTWSWNGGDQSKRRSFLPDTKQYLITRNVPCLQRASAIEIYANTIPDIPKEEAVEDGDWISTASTTTLDDNDFETLPFSRAKNRPIPTISSTIDDDNDHGSIATTAIPTATKTDAASKQQQETEGDTAQREEKSIPDISDIYLDEEEDDAIAPSKETPPPLTTTIPSPLVTSSPPPVSSQAPSGVLQTRTYDILISYDKYYQVPRVWLVGYNEDRSLLSHEDIMQDIISDYYSVRKERKTVSVEDHPHRNEGGKVVSIHPCRHAHVMKKLADVLCTEEEEFKVEHYMVLFLKFISSVVPTIEYDFTLSAGM